MEEIIQESKLAEEVASEAYIELATYTAKTRNYPNLIDGMKMVYRRMIYQSMKYKSRVKSATIVGETLKIHPHGDVSVYDVLVSCACKYGYFPLYHSQGNFGGCGFGPSAMRYTEAYLNEIARLLYLDLIDYVELEEGEVDNQEPVALPALIPYAFLVGCSGFSVGMPAPNIPPYNVMDLINYYIDRLEGKNPVLPKPDYNGIIFDCDKIEHSDELLKNSTGTLWFEPIIIQEDYNKLVVTEVTPNSSIDKVNKKLAYAIDQEWVDFIDETDESGYRFVYVINNFNKISLEEVKKVISKALYCSMSYRLMFEYKNKVYYSSFEFVVKHQLKYLRECVIRKYIDYLSKSEHKSQVYEAITKLRESEDIVSQLHKMELSDLKKIIMDWGFSEAVASDTVNKGIRYLTKSHDEEIQKEKENRKSYQEYIDNPDKYLLEKYYQLKDMVVDFYNSRSHSIFKDDIAASDTNRCELSEDKKQILFGSDKSINWDSILYIVTEQGNIGTMIISKFNTSDLAVMSLQDNDNPVALISDKCKYILMVISNQYIYVVDRSKVTAGLNAYVKMWDDCPVQFAIGCNSDNITLIDDRNHKYDIHLEDWVKSRVSKPRYLCRYNIKSYVDEDGTKHEIKA